MMQFPDALKKFQAQLEATRRPMIGAEVMEEAPASALSSRIGGLPWLPMGQAYPRDLYDKPLRLLAQINFAETPALEPLPKAGLLQIFIGTDDLYGCDFDDFENSPGFACLFHADVAQAGRAEFPEITLNDADYSPLQQPSRARALTFARGDMLMDWSDYRFAEPFEELIEDEDLMEAYSDFCQAVPAIRLGGYPNFTQSDPRERDETLGDFNLLTIDTTDGIMWGDSGVGQFLMREEDLRAGDFSRVRYNWDCC